MLVHSRLLDGYAQAMRRRKRGMWIGPSALERVYLTASQASTAARLLREAEPSICNGDVQERPGFIEPERQDDPSVLVFSIGVLPSTEYRIDRRGRVRSEAA